LDRFVVIERRSLRKARSERQCHPSKPPSIAGKATISTGVVNSLRSERQYTIVAASPA